jgi:hypothetical protein
MKRTMLTVSGVTGQTVYVPIDYHRNFSFTVSEATVTQISDSRLIIRNLDPYNSIIVTSIKMFDPFGAPVEVSNPSGDPLEVFDGMVNYLPRTLYGGESMSQGVAGPVFAPFGGLPLYHFTDGRPYLIVEWVSESHNRVLKPKIGATITQLRFNDLRAPEVRASGPELISQYYIDGVVLEQTWGNRWR